MKKVYVALSGGVDSSVTAALLKNRGFNVVGVFMKPWQPESDNFCLWKQDREDAMRIASKLAIPFKTWGFSREYKKYVIDYMIKEYKSGRTPNPDVMCNKKIKFGLFFNRAIKEGADFIATGHYVRKFTIPNSQLGNLQIKNYGLRMAKDKNKDQSYFLWTLTQKQLSKCLFPIGNYTKPEVRKMAKEFGLINYNKKDSQGVCFIGQLDMKTFLQSYIKPRIGKIINMDGKVIGNHEGVYYYTIGQRHGLNIRNGQGPYYVVFKDLKKNFVIVGQEKDLLGTMTRVSQINWLSRRPNLLADVDVKVRYRAESKQATLSKNGVLNLEKGEKAITSGQSAVFYRGQELLGGGIIK